MGFNSGFKGLKKCEDQIRRQTNDIRTRDANCTEAEDWIFQFTLKCNKSVTYV